MVWSETGFFNTIPFLCFIFSLLPLSFCLPWEIFYKVIETTQSWMQKYHINRCFCNIFAKATRVFPSHLIYDILTFVHPIFASVGSSVSPCKNACVFFLRTLFLFLEQFLSSQQKFSGKYRGFSYTSCPYTSIAFPMINITHQSGPFVVIDGPPLTHNYHAMSIVYIGVHSWCTFYKFGQMYNDMCPPL